MIPEQNDDTQTGYIEEFPPFAESGDKVEPTQQKYAQGYLPGEVFPAQHENFLMGKTTRCITAMRDGVLSMEEELVNVVEAGGAEPSASDNTQVLAAVRYLIAQAKAEAILASHPVGSYYWSNDSTAPGSLFGGTWTQIKGVFLWAKEDDQSAGTTGGAKTVTLTSNQMPSHTHTFTGTAHTHTISGSTGSESSHTHNINGGGNASSTEPSTLTAWFHGKSVDSGAGTAHKHTISGSTGSESSHTHTINSGNTSSSGTTTTAGFRGVVVHSTSPKTNNTSTNLSLTGSFGYATGTSSTFVSGIFSKGDSASGAGWGNTGTWTVINIDATHSHDVTASGYLYGKTDAGTSHSHGVGTLTNSNESAHTHSVTASGWINGKTGAGSSHSHGVGTLANASTTATGTNGSTGGGAAHDNMPPYRCAYCWQRTA